MQYFPIFSNCVRLVIQGSLLYIPPPLLRALWTLTPRLTYQTCVPNQITARIYYYCLATLTSTLVEWMSFKLDRLNVRICQKCDRRCFKSNLCSLISFPLLHLCFSYLYSIMFSLSYLVCLFPLLSVISAPRWAVWSGLVHASAISSSGYSLRSK